ncbi:MAG: hypothetical protein EOP56_13195 [Sphingobacteriales bacterium]|nr:MAG: hypothetical protein EOP56_13195 [Sphingobacteriales bacterium]
MRFKSILILVLLAALSQDASAQRRKAAKKPKAKTETKKNTRKSAKEKKAEQQAQKNKNAEPKAAAKTITPDTVKGATIEVLQSYKPELRKVYKPVISPSMPPADTSRPEFTYQVPQQTLLYSYNSFPLRPLALGKDSVVLPYSDYLKVGGGNLSTLLIDAGIGRFRGEDYETAINLQHNSRRGHIYEQRASRTGLTANGTLHRDGMAHSGFVDVSSSRYHYYGYDHGLLHFPSENIRQSFTDINLGVSTKNEGEGFMGINYNPSLAFSLYKDRYDATETAIDLKMPVSYDLDTATTLQMSLNILFAKYAQPTANISQNNNILQLTPGVKFRNRGIVGYAGLYPTFGRGMAYLLPDIWANFNIENTQINFTAGYRSDLRQNTYEQLSTRNPFMRNDYEIRQTRTNEMYVSGRTNVGSHIALDARLAWKQYRNLPLFINDTFGDAKQFVVAYDPRVNAIVLEGTARYQIANTFSVGLSPAFVNFVGKTYRRVWHEPAIRMTGDVMVKPLKKLTVTGYLLFMDQLYALKRGDVTEKLNPILDLGGSAEYEITDRIGAFAQVNNLLNNRYQRWYMYETFGFNIFGGVRVKF